MIIESIQYMALEGSPLVALAQQGVEATNQVLAGEWSTGNHRGEPNVDNRLQDHRLLHDAIRQEMSPHQGGDVSLLLPHHSGRLFGQTSSILAILTNMMALAIPKNSSRSITQTSRSRVEMTG
jgi:hypothetical protein